MVQILKMNSLVEIYYFFVLTNTPAIPEKPPQKITPGHFNLKMLQKIM